jgi:hypothetical protein
MTSISRVLAGLTPMGPRTELSWDGLRRQYRGLLGKAKDGMVPTTLCQAAQPECDIRHTLALLAAGANPNEVEEDTEMTPLHYAAYWGRADVVKALLGAGAKADAPNGRGHPALLMVRMKEIGSLQHPPAVECASLLLEATVPSFESIEKLSVEFRYSQAITKILARQHAQLVRENLEREVREALMQEAEHRGELVTRRKPRL